MSTARQTIVPLHPTRALRFRLSINHAYAGLLLLIAGIGALPEEARHVLPWAEILVGVAVLTAIIIELRKPEHTATGKGAEHEKIRWVEVMAGCMLIVEGFHARHPGRWFQPALFYWIGGLISLAIGIGLLPVSRTRRMIIVGERFSIRTSLFRRRELAWREIASYAFVPRGLQVTTSAGRQHTMRLRSVANRDEVERIFAEHAARYMPKAAKRP
jgi:hypothetical protein